MIKLLYPDPGHTLAQSPQKMIDSQKMMRDGNERLLEHMRDRRGNTMVDREDNGTQRRNVEFRTLCVGGCSLGCLPGSRWAS